MCKNVAFVIFMKINQKRKVICRYNISNVFIKIFFAISNRISETSRKPVILCPVLKIFGKLVLPCEKHKWFCDWFSTRYLYPPTFFHVVSKIPV